MKNNKGITLISLIVYMAVIVVVTAMVIRITTHFRDNMEESADVSFEIEFQKINLLLLDEVKKTGNKISEVAADGSKVAFSSGNQYKYNSSDNAIYLNDTVKVCENIERCVFGTTFAENGKGVLILNIKIKGIEKQTNYTFYKNEGQGQEINLDEYLGSIVSYYLKAGDYVDYTPDTGTYKVAGGEYGTGHTATQSFTTGTGTSALKWRILSIDEATGDIELVSEKSAHSLTFGAHGFNHCVEILNDLCEKLYSKTVNGKRVAIARSINNEDIDAKTTYDKTTYTSGTYKYGEQINLGSFSEYDRKYLNICSKMEGFILGNENQIGGLGPSEGLDDGVVNSSGVTEYKTVTGHTNGSSNTSLTQTYYRYVTSDYINPNLGINTVPNDLLWTEETWIASRVFDTNATGIIYRLMYTTGTQGKTGGVYLTNSYDATNYTIVYSKAVRPVVKLNAVELLDFSNGDGSKENPWKMKSIIEIPSKEQATLLPVEYQQVEYIQSTGTQYINTGYYPNENTNAKYKVLISSFSNSGPHILSSNKYYFPFLRGDSCFLSKRGNEEFQDRSITPKTDTIYEYQAFWDNKIILNNEEVGVLSSVGSEDTTPLYLGAYGGQPTNSVYRLNGKIYYCKIYNGEELVRDMVPCYRKLDDVVGMFDTVNDVFYINAGTGTFEKGPDIN